MREIKFRAWDKNNHEMYKNKQVKRMTYYSNPIVFDDGFIQLECEGQSAIGDHPIGNRHILMQFTGIKDNNGKEIYEGDILRFTGYKREWNEVVEWENIGKHTSFGGGSHNATVIGNNYENPELLKAK